MFCGRISPKKSFQKPNILRKKPQALVTPKNGCVQKDDQTGVSTTNGYNPRVSQTGVPFTTTSNNASKTKAGKETISTDSHSKENRTKLIGSINFTSEQSVNNNNNTEDPQNCINFELFLSDNIQLNSHDAVDDDWSINHTDTSEGIVIGDVGELDLDSDSEDDSIMLKMIPMSEITLTQQTQESKYVESDPSISPQNLTIEYLANSIMKFKCDFPNCAKRFKSELKLKKHKLAHGAVKPLREYKIECPVKKKVDGVMKPCAQLFYDKDKLAEHLNMEHTTSDAAFKCSDCGRAFFWEVGMRAHVRAGCGRAQLACSWPGCGAAFRHPCRLREHERKHTGDRPYPCRFPNCPWSFRTAGKLARHARRHTGERRHACPTCQRAFRRPEHLRHHLTTHTHVTNPCPHQGCQRKFVNVSALVTHLKKKHEEEPSALEIVASCSVEPTVTIDTKTVVEKETTSGIKAMCEKQEATSEKQEANDTSVPLFDLYRVESECSEDEIIPAEVVESELEDTAARGEEGVACGGRAARTHCTWPLHKHMPAQHVTADLEPLLDGDVQVELSEGGESNIYTVRSDLFLHGNVLNNEDSVQMATVSVAEADSGEGESAGGTGSMDSDLGLLDPHPAIDLMQEELLYTDAVDESSYHVFLLSGEEIQIV